MPNKKKFYITTPIYYPSGKWHLGHCYTTVYGDAIARYRRMQGYDVFYLTGTDEHGQKIEKRAQEAGVEPKKFVDGLVDNIKKLWKTLNVSYDGFIRTTDDNHVKAVQKIFKRLYEKGDIYKGSYSGKYCTPCESFWTESQLIDGKCPDCGREVTDAQEECYFFRLSKYADRVRKLLTETDFLSPSSRVNEMVKNFIDAGLEDMAVSRTSFKWGIPVDFDDRHVVYVWIDALTNYLTAIGYDGEKGGELFNKYWPCDLHLMAKEIVRFHTIIWPALLMALDVPLPKKVVGHGWLLFDGDKMSKSKGNVIDPFVLAQRYGADSLRYYLLRAMPFGADGSYTSEYLLSRINSDLCNDLGNLLRRTIAMSKQYFDGKVTVGESGEFDEQFVAQIKELPKKVDALVDVADLSKALEAIFDLTSSANKYIDSTKPWVLAKDEKSLKRLSQVIYNLLESIRVVANLLIPFIPETADKIFTALNVKTPTDLSKAEYGKVSKYSTKEIDALFPRLDVKKELDALEELALKAEKVASENQKTTTDENKTEEDNMITIDEFFKTQLRVATVIACEKVEKADKLLKLTLKVGDEQRTVVSGIAKSYTPQEMIGKNVVLVYNLKPAKLRGIESEGMILCATCGDKVVLVSPEQVVESGSEVC